MRETLTAYFAIVLSLNDAIKALSDDGLSVGGHRITLPNPALLQPPSDVILVVALFGAVMSLRHGRSATMGQA